MNMNKWPPIFTNQKFCFPDESLRGQSNIFGIFLLREFASKISFLDKKIEQYLTTYLAALEKNTILVRFQFVIALIDLYNKIFTAFDRGE